MSDASLPIFDEITEQEVLVRQSQMLRMIARAMGKPYAVKLPGTCRTWFSAFRVYSGILFLYYNNAETHDTLVLDETIEI